MTRTNTRDNSPAQTHAYILLDRTGSM